MKVDILSLFPGYFRGPLDETILAGAIKKKLLEIGLVNIRDFAEDKHRRADDRPYGGGPGMVLLPEPLMKAIDHVRTETSRVIYLSPQGRRLDQSLANRLAGEEHLVLICGHYEGIDERVIEAAVDEEVSIGDFVLTNGCLAACVLLDVVARYIPGVLGNSRSVEQDSFADDLLDCPHYTRPVDFRGMRVPEVLLSGDHKKIREWRASQALGNTKKKRADLIKYRSQT